jgi:hypothetical protein
MKTKEVIRLMEDILISILLDEKKRGDVLISIFKNPDGRHTNFLLFG